MMRVCIRDEEPVTIARFLSGLSLEIRKFVYKDINDLVQLCINVEQQILRKYFKKEKVQPKENS